MVFETPHGAKAASVAERCRWGAWKHKREQHEEGRREERREGELPVREEEEGGQGAALRRRGMQIVSMCGEDRGAELAAVRCG